METLSTLGESIGALLRTLPKPIKTYLLEERYTFVAQQLMGKYGLHLDQGAVLERDIALLLLGVKNPDEFVESLVKEALLPKETALAMVTDVNQEVFIPLQARIREENMQKETPSRAPAASAPRYAPTPVPVQATVVAPSILAPQPPMAQRVPTAAPLPPKLILPTQAPAGTEATVNVPAPTASINRLEGRTLPPPVYDPSASRRTPPPPPNLPTSQPQTPRPYGADPYREPLEP